EQGELGWHQDTPPDRRLYVQQLDLDLIVHAKRVAYVCSPPPRWVGTRVASRGPSAQARCSEQNDGECPVAAAALLAQPARASWRRAPRHSLREYCTCLAQKSAPTASA